MDKIKVRDKFIDQHNSMRIGFIGPIKIYKENLKREFKNAHAGNDLSQWNVGLYYFTGEFCIKNYGKALKWFIKSTDVKITLSNVYSYCESCFAIGMMYYLGQGIYKDDAVAFYWFNKGAIEGNERCKEIIKDNSDFLKEETTDA